MSSYGMLYKSYTPIVPPFEVAEQLLKEGVIPAIFPVQVRSKIPAIKGWQEKATNDLEIIEQWKKEFPNANYGIPTGKGLIVIDVDGQAGADSIARLEEELGALPETFIVNTGKGRHLYFSYDPKISIRNSVSSLGAGIDIRCEGGYVVGPGSIHPNGGIYERV